MSDPLAVVDSAESIESDLTDLSRPSFDALRPTVSELNRADEDEFDWEEPHSSPEPRAASQLPTTVPASEQPRSSPQPRVALKPPATEQAPVLLERTRSDSELAAQLQKELQAQCAQEFTCPICQETLLIEDDACTLLCDHRVCFDCMAGYVTCKIGESKVSDQELRCPTITCRHPAPIDEAIVRSCVSVEQHALFLNLRTLTLSGVVACPRCPCLHEIIPREDDEQHRRGTESSAVCGSCGFVFCYRCFLPWVEHRGYSCEEAKRLADSAEAGEVRRALGVKDCPRCATPITKEVRGPN